MKYKLKWNKEADLPFGTTSPQHVVIGTTLYVGGGQTEGNISKLRRNIMKYSINSNKWELLPPSPYIHFGLGKYAGKLISVGRKP